MALRSIDELRDIEHSLCDVPTFVSKANFELIVTDNIRASIHPVSRSCRPDAARRLQTSDRKTRLSG
jgi:hypothetical protein